MVYCPLETETKTYFGSKNVQGSNPCPLEWKPVAVTTKQMKVCVKYHNEDKVPTFKEKGSANVWKDIEEKFKPYTTIPKIKVQDTNR